MIELDIWGISDAHPGPVVLLRADDRVLPILITPEAANSIQLGLLGQTIGRPITHDLVCNILAGLRGSLQAVTIYKLENDTFFAYLTVEQHTIDGEVDQVLKIDSRPSDGIALVARVGCPLYAVEELMNREAKDIAALGLVQEQPPESDSDDDFPV